MLPEVLTVRLLVLAVVVLISFVLLLPTVRGAVQQQAQLDAMRSELASATAERDELTAQLERWDDRSYVIQQARSRLNYVLPGDTAWRVVDADEIEGTDAAADAAAEGPATAVAPTGAPWYEAMWESMLVADRAAVPEDPAPSTSPTPVPGSSSGIDPSPDPSGDPGGAPSGDG